MEVKTCKMCKKIFNYIGGEPLCPSCAKKMEEKFQEVKKYIQENNGASLDQVAEECDVSSKTIQRWIREERLELKAGSGIMLYCEACGKPVTSGRFCDACKNSLASELGASIQKPKAAPTKEKPKDNRNKMRFLKD